MLLHLVCCAVISGEKVDISINVFFVWCCVDITANIYLFPACYSAAQHMQ